MRSTLIKKSKGEKIFCIVMLTIAIVHLVLLITPFIWLITQAFNSYYNNILNPFSLPDDWVAGLSNFSAAMKHMDMVIYTERGPVRFTAINMIQNSMLIALLIPFFNVSVQFLLAYLIAQYNHLRICKYYYAFNLFIMIFPSISTLGSSLMIHKQLGTYDNWTFLLVNYTGTGANLLYFYSMFKGMPAAYKEAAQIDGAGHLTIMLRIYFPIGVSLWFAFFILGFMEQWQNYQINVTMLPSYPTISFGVFRFQQFSTLLGASEPEQLAGLVLLSLPVTLLWACSQKLITSKMYVGGLKG